MSKVSVITAWPQKAITFIREAREELKKVQWPSRDITIRYTIIVVVSSVAVGFIIGGIDYLLTLIVERYVL